MKQLLSALVGCLILGLVGCRGTATSGKPSEKKEASNKEKLVGVWEFTKPAGTNDTVEFFADGKMRTTVKVKLFKKGDKKKVPLKEMTVLRDGTYEVEGDKLKMTREEQDTWGHSREEKETMTIRSLTDKVLVTVDEKGRVDEFKRK